MSHSKLAPQAHPKVIYLSSDRVVNQVIIQNCNEILSLVHDLFDKLSIDDLVSEIHGLTVHAMAHPGLNDAEKCRENTTDAAFVLVRFLYDLHQHNGFISKLNQVELQKQAS